MTPITFADLPVQPTDLRPLRTLQAGALVFAPRTHDAIEATVELHAAPRRLVWPWLVGLALAVLGAAAMVGR